MPMRATVFGQVITLGSKLDMVLHTLSPVYVKVCLQTKGSQQTKLIVMRPLLISIMV